MKEDNGMNKKILDALTLAKLSCINVSEDLKKISEGKK